jgi:hypothetical protein
VRIVSNLLYVLACIVAALAVVLYVYLHGMACSYATGQGGCRIAAPWELGVEDFRIMILIPGGVVFLLAGVAAMLRPRKRLSWSRPEKLE